MSDRQIRFFSLVWLGWILSAATRQLIRYFPQPDAPLNGDAFWIYLPNARKWLDHSWTFFTTDPYSYHVAPLGYWWAAIWRADPATIQMANCILFLACVVLMWRCASRLGGFWAGVTATALLVYYPTLTSFIPQVLTEPLYLFGLLLFIAASVEYLLGTKYPRWLLSLSAFGLMITLLSRPVLQFMAVGTVLMLSIVCLLLCRRSEQVQRERYGKVLKISRHFLAAIAIALTLPIAVVAKNGVYFGLWSLGTGAGTGLLYGVSPFKMGQEPVYLGFKYDAYQVAKTANPETTSTLSKVGDSDNARVAISIIKNTTFIDNTVFFWSKFKAWTLYSTPELLLYPKARQFRIFEWLSIALAIAIGTIRFAKSQITKASSKFEARDRDSTTTWVLLLLGLLTLAMIFQLLPVLYNARYNMFFIEPTLILLSATSIATLIRFAWPHCLWNRNVSPPSSPTYFWIRGILLTIAFIAILIPGSNALLRKAQRNEAIAIDPLRLGPVQTILDQRNIGEPTFVGARRPPGEHQWLLDSGVGTMQIPINLDNAEKISPVDTMDAIWLIRLSVRTTTDNRKCSNASVAVADSYPSEGWYEPPQTFKLRTDGAMHTYATHGNDRMRPSKNTTFSITFNCPAGSIVTFGNLELLKSVLPEAARDLIQNRQPIDPYFQREREQTPSS
ncbi:ArnT family glycosyltransferase [Diaphorobacter caeni]|uniref:ArnT family glycosyltransferase n=1 Tax=Diaphorobacter caeni TaxID=2784387 RepID=UPI001890B4F1|nr:hypothetical protein [Diaphorobacter caeni]MBF5003976.1 hypothetical protein [Diaphorobacter caeni]